MSELAEQADAPSPPAALPPATLRALPFLVAVAFFMESLDTTILNTAVPTISGALGVAPLSMKAVLASYTLSLAVFIPISGWMADRFGTRRVFASAIGLFTLGSLLCGLCRDVHLLVACRVLQGCGGAMMVPVGRLTIVKSFPKFELIRAMSFVAIPALVGPMIGPMTGGLIVAYLPWSYIFFVNLPIGIAGLVLVYLWLPDFRGGARVPLDVEGMILFGAGIALLSYVLEVFGEHELGGREILGLLAISLALLAGYGFHAARTSFPLLELSLMRVRTFATSVVGSFFTRLATGGVPFLLPLLYQVGLGFTPIQSGMLILPQALAAMGMKGVMRPILKKLGYRGVLVSNTLLIGVVICLFATIGAATPVWVILLTAFAYGGLTSMQFTCMNTLAFADVADEHSSNASAVASTAQQLSLSFGVAAAGLATAVFVPDRLHSSPGEIVDGVHGALFVLGGFTILSTVVFSKLRRDDGANETRGPSVAIKAGNVVPPRAQG